MPGNYETGSLSGVAKLLFHPTQHENIPHPMTLSLIEAGI